MKERNLSQDTLPEGERNGIPNLFRWHSGIKFLIASYGTNDPCVGEKRFSPRNCLILNYDGNLSTLYSNFRLLKKKVTILKKGENGGFSK